MSGNLIVVLGDQLSRSLTALKQGDPARDTILMCEVANEATYVRHHKKKLAFIFSAMRHFAQELGGEGWRVDYRRLDQTGADGSFTREIARAVASHKPARIIVTEPGEWRVRQEMAGWGAHFSVPVEILDDDRFICSRDEFADWADGRKQLRMEFFYREMRRKTGLLMHGDVPEGGRWNFDAENRKAAAPDLLMPKPPRFAPDAITQEVLALVAARFGHHFGDLEPFWFAVTRSDALAALDHFIVHTLERFGDYQDAMLEGEAFLYHSVLSLYLNVGLLDPLEICRRAEAAYLEGRVPLNAAEGFIRQIIGWREYVRGLYWLKMPAYRAENFLGHDRPLPDFYWTGETDMACLRAAITQTRREAYAHHIQRLMVTGNFALLAGIAPAEVEDWYLAVYADAFEWVELPNTHGMALYADGGVMASKPYAASGAYIHRMSNHCAGCAYDVREKLGAKACPFNYLYWAFLIRHEARLRSNPRLAMPYRTLAGWSAKKRRDYLDVAERFLTAIS